jgi:Mn-dependent DtxR family transcriptional regulator
MTPLRRKALAVIQEQVAQGKPVLVAAVARRIGVDRRSARRIIADVQGLAAI